MRLLYCLALMTIHTMTFSVQSIASEVSLRYEDFFSRLKVLHQQNYQLIELTFSVPKTAECELESANITTETESLPLTYTSAQRLFLPYDEQLKQQRALVNLSVKGDQAVCGLAVQIRAKSPHAKYQQAELRQLYQEMDSMQAAMKGFPMKYFHQAIVGLQFNLNPDTRVRLTRQTGIEEYNLSGDWLLTAEQISQLNDVNFSIEPLVISPRLE